MAGPDRFLSRLLWFTLAAALLLTIWHALPRIEYWLAPEQALPRTVSARGDLAADEKATIELFENARDSVVFITTRAQVRDFWTRNVFTVPRGTGSGFIWDDAGHVVTNFHVIENASEASVKLADGRSYRAFLIGVSPAHDIAVLRIGVGFKRPPPVHLGTSTDLKVGQKVFAIGNPFGLDWTLTSGIVSALDRSLGGDNGNTIEHLIQTDAAINPGNSGGPLLDSAGRLIGINTAIYSPSGTSAGIGFAVPVDTVNRVVPQLIAGGRYIRPALGIEADESLNTRLKRILGVEGVVILRVVPGSAAAAAGLTGATLSPDGGIVAGDIITAVDGQPVDSLARLLGRLDERRVGETVRLKVLRSGREVEVAVALQPGV
ncbi:trypsin-like peptidase domain-containing protein [Accumulibacter sp.]|uniref:S1C family serine protease n=1 Tax=Accumulibacter sp. TaxID=2053492 RepID=UPI00260B309C|nr:trypsin-like peptidase domain-containing protein [Accumulibacter sp.]